MTWGRDCSTINPTNFRKGSGFLGIVALYGKLVGICAMVKSRYIGDGHPTFNMIPYDGAL